MFGPNSLTLSVPETAKYLDSIHRNTIGLEDWITRLDNAFETSTVNYPPYNLVKEDSCSDIAPLNQIKVLSYKDKGDWILEQKYNIGKKGKVEETQQ